MSRDAVSAAPDDPDDSAHEAVSYPDFSAPSYCGRRRSASGRRAELSA